MSFLETWKKTLDSPPQDTIPKDAIHSHNDSAHKGKERKHTIRAKPEVDSEFDRHIQDTIAELNRRGVSIMDYPPATRHRALELEESMTQAANAGDRRMYLEYLNQWRGCFH